MTQSFISLWLADLAASAERALKRELDLRAKRRAERFTHDDIAWFRSPARAS